MFDYTNTMGRLISVASLCLSLPPSVGYSPTWTVSPTDSSELLWTARVAIRQR